MVTGILRKLHLWLGLLSGIIVLVVAFTGCSYAFEEEIRDVMYRHMLYVQPGSEAKPLHEIIETAKAAFPQQPLKNIRVRSAAESFELSFKGKTSVYVDPWSGKVLGMVNKDRDVPGILLQVHRTLYLGDTGKIITGTSAVIFVFMLVSGIIMWWPAGSRFTKRKFTLMSTAGYSRRLFDLHSVLGFYASWIIIFTALTGIVWSFKWAENSLYTLTGSKKADTRSLRSTDHPDTSTVVIDHIWEQTKELDPTASEYVILIPEEKEAAVRVVAREKGIGFFLPMRQFFFDGNSGRLIKEIPYGEVPAGEKLKAANYNIHTGKALGLPGQFAVFFASLIVASLPVTGFLWWWRRKK